MREVTFEMERSRPLTGNVWELRLRGDASAIQAPGQFVNIALPGKFLRRPISVCDWEAGSLTLLIQEAGAGTRELVRLPAGTALSVLTGLGRGFDLSRAGERPILAGGGIGIAPLYALAKAMGARGLSPVAALGFRSAGEAFYVEAFRALGCEVSVATEDGNFGTRGLVTDLLRARPDRDYVLCCGPLPMLRAVGELPHLTGGQFSFEARMGCGFGACMGCSLPMADGMRRVCREGPVFFQEEIRWQI